MCVDHGALTRIRPLLSERNVFLKKCLIVTGDEPLHSIARSVAREIGCPSDILIVRDSTLAETAVVQKAIDRGAPDAVIGVGGGVAIDVAKYAASEKAVGFISIPTAVSNDGISSPIAVIKCKGRTRSLNAHMPMAVIADLDVIQKSPVRTIRSGMGDLVSNLSACADWRLAWHKGKDRIDDFAETISRNAAIQLIEHRSAALNGSALLKTLIEGLIMSGIAMGITGSSRPSSGAEHMISHAIDLLYHRGSSHGEQVGVATLFTLHLHHIKTDAVRRMFTRFSMAATPAALGLSRKEFLCSVRKAPEMRRGRYSILDETDVKTIEKAYHAVFP